MTLGRRAPEDPDRILPPGIPDPEWDPRVPAWRRIWSATSLTVLTIAFGIGIAALVALLLVVLLFGLERAIT